MKKLNNFFASANTNQGFVNEFANINNQKKKGFMYIIKGGSGTGKSTLMKKVGEYFTLLGHEIEYFYCSSDKSSLDGVRIADKNICIVDGTAPHVTEANLPGVDSKIINVGKFIKDDVIQFENELLELVFKKKVHFDNMYNLLNSAGAIFNVKINSLKQLSSDINVEEIVDGIIKENNLIDNQKEGRIRKLFCEAIDENGLFTYLNNDFLNDIKINNNEYVNFITLDCLAKTLERYGYEVVKFCNILNCELSSAIYLPDEGIVFRSDDEGNCANSENVKEHNAIINNLLRMAGNELYSARELHMQIENYYIQNVDFEGLNKMTTDLIDEIHIRINK